MPDASQLPAATSANPGEPQESPTGPGIADRILQFLGGGPKKTYSTDGQGKVIEQQGDVSRGTMAKHILAAVITGMAAGSQQRGPGGAERAFGAGFDKESDAAGKQEAEAHARAERDAQNQQASQLRAAQIFASNASAVHTIRMAEHLQGETFQSMVDRDSEAFSQVDPGDVVAKDVPQDVAHEELKSGKYGATSHNVYVTGYADKKDAKGQPVIDPKTGEAEKEALLTITNDNPVPLTKADASRYQAAGITGVPANPADGQMIRQSVKRGWDQKVHAVENARGLSQKVTGGDEDFTEAMKDPRAARAFENFSRYSTGDPAADIDRMEKAKNKDGSNVYSDQTISVLRDAFGGDKAEQFHQGIADKQAAGKAAAEAKAKGPIELANEVAKAAATQHFKIEQATAEAHAKQLIEGKTKPVYAVDATGQKTLMSETDALNSGATMMLPVTEKQVGEDIQLNNRLADVNQKIARYEQALQTEIPDKDRGNIAGLLASDKLKIGAFGAELPVDRLNQAMDEENIKGLSDQARKQIIAYANAREALVGYQRVLSGSGRSSEKSMELQLATLPSPATADKRFANESLSQFKENLKIVGQGLPKIPGIKSPEQMMGAPAGGGNWGEQFGGVKRSQ